MKLKPEDLDTIAERMRPATMLRDGSGKAKVTVHMGTCGIAAGARKIMKAFMTQIEGSEAEDIMFTTSGCAGLCSHEPMATVEIQGEAPVKYVNLDAKKVERIFQEHIIGGKVVAEYALAKGSERVG